jgi:hypothetical protein
MKPVYLIVPSAIILGLFATVIALRINTSTRSTGKADEDGGGELKLSKEDSVESLRDSFRKANEFEAFRAAVQQLNGHVESSATSRPRALTSAEQATLKSAYGLDDGEMAEVNRAAFTLLDAHYLDGCFLFRDAARSLRVEKLPPLEQAKAAFAWTVRQVRHLNHQNDSCPAQFVARRGWGNYQERALVFLAMLRQIGIDGCMLAVPRGRPESEQLRYWIPGALVDKEVYLFDTGMGLPLPGPKGQEPATLVQVRRQPELLRQLSVPGKCKYDVSEEQARQAEVHVAASLSALAPRMRYLQDLLGSSERVNLAVDPGALLQRFQPGANVAGAKVRVWNLPGDPSTPIRALRRFVPESEGGSDRLQQVRLQWVEQLVPWSLFPERLAQLPGEPGRQLRAAFRIPFVYFALAPQMSDDQLMAWLPGLAESSVDKEGKKIPTRAVRGRLPRDLVLRGKFDDASTRLVAIRGELQRQVRLIVDKPRAEVDAAVKGWCEDVTRASTTLQHAEQEARNARLQGAADTRVRDLGNLQMVELWKNSGLVVALLQAAAAEPMSWEVTYLLALCKQEQAERNPTKPGVWASAADWWRTYLEEYGHTPSAPAARFHQARVIQAMGQRDAAVAFLQDLSGSLTENEKAGRLWLARQWQAR